MNHKLVIKKGDHFDLGPQVTHIGHDNPLVLQHHMNWRIKALQAIQKNKTTNLHYTGPMALSVEAAESIRELLASTINQATKKAAPSESETLRCLTIDWYQVTEK